MSRIIHLFMALISLPCALACQSDYDCQLNGACLTSICQCRPGWTGSDCGQLDLLPAPLEHAFYRPTVATWGGSILPAEGGLHYMFLALIEGHCGLNAWQPNSAIYRAVSTTGPLGPYVNETQLLSWFSHNPTISVQPDKTLLLWHIGCGSGGGGFNNACTNGSTPTPPPPPPPPPVRFVNADGDCLVPAGPFPCWISPQNFTVCPLTVGDCARPDALWEVENGNIASNASAGAAINIDCNSCTVGSLAKLFGQGGSGLSYDATNKQIVSTGCSSMCLSNGVADGGQKPCGGNSEPWSVTQPHLDACNASSTQGWVQQPASQRLTSSAEHIGWPSPCTDVNVLVSTDGPLGTWTQSGILQGTRKPFPYETDNPAPLVFANGSTWVMFRSWNPPGNTTTPIGIARSDTASWNTTYTLTTQPVPRGFYNESDQPPRYIPLEDPFMWQDIDSGTYHALYHNMGGCPSVGCHAFSSDGYTWYLATSDPYTSTVTFTDGSQIQYGRRERPHLVFSSLGHPAFLTNGVQESWSYDHSYTLVQQINVPYP